jgi:hypothetical protein
MLTFPHHTPGAPRRASSGASFSARQRPQRSPEATLTALTFTSGLAGRHFEHVGQFDFSSCLHGREVTLKSETQIRAGRSNFSGSKQVLARTGRSKRQSNEAAGEKEPEAYPLGYVEDSLEPRTKLREGARLGAPGVARVK